MADDKTDSATKSLTRLQDFDLQQLPQTQRLGQDNNFQEAVEPARRLIALFSQIPVQFVEDFSDSLKDRVQQNADSTYNLLSQIMEFDTKQGDAYSARNQLIQSLQRLYDPTFDAIAPAISYGASRLRDFSALEREARAGVQAAKDRADEAVMQLEEREAEAQRILQEVRKVAAEQGVSQQATYFQSESASHETEAGKWQNWTIGLAAGLGVYALISLALHKIPLLEPASTYDALQLGLSKVLIFGVIAYMLLLAARNFLSHKHNAIVNRHRYNALLTFKALADAAGSEENRDVVLNYAASCIFAPQDTGYAKGGAPTEAQTNIVQAIPRLFSPTTPPA